MKPTKTEKTFTSMDLIFICIMTFFVGFIVGGMLFFVGINIMGFC